MTKETPQTYPDNRPAVGAQVERSVRPRVRYVLHPGYVMSATDRQYHFIGGPRLAALYGVNIRDREAVVFGDMPGFREQPGDVHLHPRYDVDYSLPAGPNDSFSGLQRPAQEGDK